MTEVRLRVMGCALLMALLPALGCASLRFVPTEPITVANADRIEPVYSCQFAEYSVEMLLLNPDRACSLGRVAVDSSRHRLHVHRRSFTGLRSPLFFSPGIHTIDLKTGLESRWTEIGGFYDTSTCHFHPHHNLALNDGVRLLDIEDDDHRIVMRSTSKQGHWFYLSVPSHPVVDEHRFLFIREQFNVRPYGPSDLVYVDCRTRAVSAEYPLTHLGRDLHFSAAANDYVLMYRDDSRYEPDQLIVLQSGENGLAFVNRLRLEDGWRYRSALADWSLNWWITSETRGDDEARVCVYSLPELERVAEIPGIEVGEMAFIPATRVLVVIPTLDQKALRLYQLEQQTEIARIVLPAFDYAGDWDIVADPAGLYLGVSGCEWVHLFAVRPPGG